MTSTPGKMNCRYSWVEPDTAPPNRYTNSSRNMIGMISASSSMPGLRRVLVRLRPASSRLCRASANGRAPGSAARTSGRPMTVSVMRPPS
ncbi:hypothetical protein [Actinomadura sp. CNU-125]|uniref:hypothetical protein n=1 Tax=Actinomadura sp. CNU-125 TaxID=1904961 RepID=UPI0021CC5FE3|nr:hypothetical protein [Actinomadura sp. CNU-125]